MGNALYAAEIEKVLAYAKETMDVNKVLVKIDSMRSEYLGVDFVNEAMLKALRFMSETLENRDDVSELSGMLDELGLA